MRGSLKKQIGTALKCILALGRSRHEAKRENNGRSPFIHSLGTFDRTFHRLLPLAEWMDRWGICDVELLDENLAGEYLVFRLEHHARRGNCRQSFKVEVSALGSLEKALTAFSRLHRPDPIVYDFTASRLSFSKKAKILSKYTSKYSGRALPDPVGMIKALELEHHKLMASLQFYAGCRTEGVGAPQRHVPGGNRLRLENFCDGEGVLFSVLVDEITGKEVQPFWTKEKGGKVAEKYCPVNLAEEVIAYITSNPDGLGDVYRNYLQAVNKAMRRTGQAVQGRGTHALRFNYAQRRMDECLRAGLGVCRTLSMYFL
jgi:hypothetical protein